MKIVSKILLIIVVAFSMVAIVPQNNVVFADSATDVLADVAPDTSKSAESASMATVVNRVLGFLQIASALLAVVVIAATGFRYIMETPDMKNELKKSMIPIIVGILLVFFAASIAKFFIGMFQNTNG